MTDTPSAPSPDDPAAREADPEPREADPAWDRLEDQLKWYDDNSAKNKNWFTSLKIVQLVCAAGVPVMASIHAAVWVTGGLGAVVVVVEGIQQLGQYQANWINYRSTAEALGHEKFLFLAGAGLYHAAGDPKRLLAERVETVISQENTKWSATTRARAGSEKH